MAPPQVDDGIDPTTVGPLPVIKPRPIDPPPVINPPPDARNAMPGGYLRERRIPQDPWGRPFQYEMPGQHNAHSYDIWSFGADGNPGGDGVDADIGNWVEDAQAQAS